MQMTSILGKNPDAKIYAISSAAHQGLTELLRELKQIYESHTHDDDKFPHSRSIIADVAIAEQPSPVTTGARERSEDEENSRHTDIPTISLSPKELKTTWHISKTDDNKFIVTGEKIEKFARRTDMNNYASVNRLRDIMKKLGIKAELTSLGAEPDSIISIAGKEFTLVEDW